MKRAEPGFLALHGFTGSARDFELLAHLDAISRIWSCPDLPGHGSRGDSAFLEKLKRPLEACIQIIDTEARRLQSPPVLLGYSMGGRLALHAALSGDPARFLALVLIGAGPGLSREAERIARREQDEQQARVIETRGPGAFLETWWKLPLLQSQDRIPEPWLARWRQRRLAVSNPEGWAWSLRMLGQGTLPSLWDRLPHLKLPVLLVTGERDFKFHSLTRRMAEVLPHADCLEIPGTGHTAHLENPSVFLEHVNRWLHPLTLNRD